jgi:hypothetical protein
MFVEKIKDIKNYNEKSVITKTDKYIIMDHKADGIAIYDYNFKYIKKIFIMDHLLIDQMYPQFSDNFLLLWCDENQCFVWVDIKKEEFKIISLLIFHSIFRLCCARLQIPPY